MDFPLTARLRCCDTAGLETLGNPRYIGWQGHGWIEISRVGIVNPFGFPQNPFASTPRYFAAARSCRTSIQVWAEMPEAGSRTLI